MASDLAREALAPEGVLPLRVNEMTPSVIICAEGSRISIQWREQRPGQPDHDEYGRAEAMAAFLVEAANRYSTAYDAIGSGVKALRQQARRVRNYSHLDDIFYAVPVSALGDEIAGPASTEDACSVRKLEWRKSVQEPARSISKDDGGVRIDSEETTVGQWSVQSFDQNQTFHVLGSITPGNHNVYTTLEEAKAAAQADFERRVLSCLSTHTATGAGPDAEEEVLPCDVMVAPRTLFCKGVKLSTMLAGLRLRASWPEVGRIEPAAVPAGAGPVGEAASVWKVEQLAEQICLGGYPEDMRRELEERKNPTYWLGLPEKTREQHRRSARTVMALYARPVEEPGEVERAVAEACKPWEFATGEPPEWGSPLHQVFVAGMTYSERLLAQFLKVQAYEGGDGSEDFDCDATMSLVNIIAAAGLWDKDEHRPAAEAALAEMRERLEKVSDGNRTLPYGRDELGRFVREAWVRWAETQPNPKPSWLLAYDELPEPDKEADRQIGEAIARWTLIGDAARAALTGDAQEAGR